MFFGSGPDREKSSDEKRNGEEHEGTRKWEWDSDHNFCCLSLESDDFWKLLQPVLYVYRGASVSRINEVSFTAELGSIYLMLAVPSTEHCTQNTFQEWVFAKFSWIPKSWMWRPFL